MIPALSSWDRIYRRVFDGGTLHITKIDFILCILYVIYIYFSMKQMKQPNVSQELGCFIQQAQVPVQDTSPL